MSLSEANLLLDDLPDANLWLHGFTGVNLVITGVYRSQFCVYRRQICGYRSLPGPNLYEFTIVKFIRAFPKPNLCEFTGGKFIVVCRKQIYRILPGF